MSTYIKIHKGTGRLTGQSLCLSCTNALIRHDERGEHRECRQFTPGIVQGDVHDCNLYYSRSLPSLNSLQMIAWTLVTDKTKKIGFQAPKALPFAQIDD